MGGQPLFVVQSYEQINMTRSRFHPWGGEPDDGEDLPRNGRQPSTDHYRYLFDSVCTDHPDITVRVQKGYAVCAIRDGAHPLIALDSPPGDPNAL
jgi:hypothetical protein